MQRKILIVRQDRLGDAILATGIPREIKKRWPGSHVAVLVRSYTKPVFENNPHVDEIITDDAKPETRKESFWPMVRQLRSRRFTHALMLLPEARYNYMTFCAGIPVRVGHGIILFHALTFVRPVMTRKFQKGRHEAQYSMDLARSIGIKTENVDPEIYLTEQEILQSEARVQNWGNGKPLVGIHSTSGASAPNWKPDLWAELAKILLQEKALQVVITDYDIPQEIKNLEGALYLCPDKNTSLRADMANISALSLLVSASTGPMHIAGALKVPTLSLFCPLGACEPALWGPLGNAAEFVMPEDEYCQNQCPGDPHSCHLAGSKLASPTEVSRRIFELIN